MFSYFIEEDRVNPKIKHIIKQHLLRPRIYTPFHLNCEFSGRKICYCASKPTIKMTYKQKYKLWQGYIKTQTLLEGLNPEDLKQAQQIYNKNMIKIKSLNRNEIIQYVNSIRKDYAINYVSQPQNDLTK